MARLAGKIAMITGCGRDFGRPMARRLAAQGARISVTTVSSADAAMLAEELHAERAAGTAIGLTIETVR